MMRRVIPTHQWGYVLTALVAINFGAVQGGRFLIGLFTEPVKADLMLSDSQVGLLTGVSAGMGYLIFSLPGAWLADHYNRRRCLFIFGLAYLAGTASSALVAGFAPLFFARMLVAASEAALMALSVSLIADFLPTAKRPMGYSIFTAGVLVMISLNYVFAGILESVAGWRGVLGYFAGAYAIILATVLFLVSEPARLHESERNQSVLTVIRTLLKKPTFLMVIVLACLYVFAYMAALTWTPAFLIRTRGFSQADAANFMGMSTGLVAAAVIAVMGLIYTQSRLRSVAGPLIVGLWTSVAMVVLYVIGLQLYGVVALICLAVALATSPTVNTAFMSSVQELAQPAFRATAMALVLIPDAVIGGGAGSFVVGYLSDLGASHFGDASIQYALLAAVGASWTVAAALYWKSARSIARDAVPEAQQCTQHGALSVGDGISHPAPVPEKT